MNASRRTRLLELGVLYVGVPVGLLKFSGAPRMPNFNGYNLFSTYLPPNEIIVTLALACWIAWFCAVVVGAARFAAASASRSSRAAASRRETRSFSHVDRARTMRPPRMQEIERRVIIEPLPLKAEPFEFALPIGSVGGDDAPSRANIDDDLIATSQGDVAIVRCLGPLSIERGTRAIRKGWRVRAKEVLVYLCVHPDGASKDQLIDVVWPDAAPGSSYLAAAAELKRSMWRIRALVRTQSDDVKRRFVFKSGASYVLERGSWWVDAWEFEQLISRAHNQSAEVQAHLLSEAIELYRGEFCADYYFPWAESVRERYRRMFIRACIDLCSCIQKAEPERALVVLDRAITIESWNEELCRLAMSIEVKLNRPRDALRRFSELSSELIAAGLGEPSQGTRNVARGIEQTLLVGP